MLYNYKTIYKNKVIQKKIKGKNLLTDDEVYQIKNEGYVEIGSHFIDFRLLQG